MHSQVLGRQKEPGSHPPQSGAHSHAQVSGFSTCCASHVASHTQEHDASSKRKPAAHVVVVSHTHAHDAESHTSLAPHTPPQPGAHFGSHVERSHM